MSFPFLNRSTLSANYPNRPARDLLEDMEPDDLVDLIQDLSPELRSSVWENMSEEARKENDPFSSALTRMMRPD